MVACYGFNPCYSGNGFGSLILIHNLIFHTCFNPCYSGNGFGSDNSKENASNNCFVSILVIVEMGLVEWQRSSARICRKVSILVIVEMGLVGHYSHNCQIW